MKSVGRVRGKSGWRGRKVLQGVAVGQHAVHLLEERKGRG